jgi:hypothetical protein
LDPVGAAIIGGGVVIVALLILAGVLAVRRERRRRAALAAWAAHHGWALNAMPSTGWARRMPGRNSRGVSLTLSGTLHGRPVAIAEYSYTTTSSSGSGSSSSSTTTTHRYVLTVVWLARPGPKVAVLRRGALSRFGRTVFGDRATAIGHDQFDGAFRVVADDASVVRSVIRPELIAAHLAGQLPEWSLEGQELLAFRTGRIGEPGSIPAQLVPLVRVADLIEPAGAR